MKKIIFLFSLYIVFFASSSVFAFCFEEAGSLYNVSPRILWAISSVESNYNPYAINYSNNNGSYDYCHMQINSSHAKTLGLDAWKLLADTCYCTKVGAWVLANCMNMYGYSWEGIGCYNAGSSPENSSKRYSYAFKIYKKLQSISNK